MIDGLKVLEFLREKCGRFDSLSITYDSRSGEIGVNATKILLLEKKGVAEERQLIAPFQFDTAKDVPAFDEQGEVDVISMCVGEL